MSEKDTIYRQDAIDAIHCDITVTGRQNAELVAATIGTFADRIKALPSAQSDIPNINVGDTIYRQDAINAVNTALFPKINTAKDAEKALRNLPSAEPERKTGKWKEKKVFTTDESKSIEEWQSCCCSECGRYDTSPYSYYFREPNFCSWCGAKMEVQDE